MQKEERAIAYTAWNGHAFFYKSARAVVGCDEAERHRYRRQRQDSSTPEFSEWKPWAGEIGCGHFWSEDLRSVRAQLLAAGHQPKVALRGLCEWSALRLRASGGDCVIRELCEDAPVLQEWTQRLGVPYRGQRLAGASLEVFLHLPGTGPGAPGLVLRMPQSQDQYGGESQHHPGEPLLPLRLPAGRTGWPTLASPFLSSVPSTASCPPGKGSLRISPTWTCPSTAAEGFWTGCPMWAGDGTPSPLVRRCWTLGWRSGATFAGAWRPQRMWTNAGWSRRCRRWKRPGRKGRSTWPSSPSTRWWGSSPATWTSSIP